MLCFHWKKMDNGKTKIFAVSEILFPRKCLFQPSMSKPVWKDPFLAAKSKTAIFQEKGKTHQNTILTMCKIYNINSNKIADIKKCNGNYVEYDFRLGTVLVIFLFFWADNDLVCAPLTPEWYPLLWRHHNWAHTLVHSSKTTDTIFINFWTLFQTIKW